MSNHDRASAVPPNPQSDHDHAHHDQATQYTVETMSASPLDPQHALDALDRADIARTRQVDGLEAFAGPAIGATVRDIVSDVLVHAHRLGQLARRNYDDRRQAEELAGQLISTITTIYRTARDEPYELLPAENGWAATHRAVIELRRDRDRARACAVALEQENAELAQRPAREVVEAMQSRITVLESAIERSPHLPPGTRRGIIRRGVKASDDVMRAAATMPSLEELLSPTLDEIEAARARGENA